MSNCTPKHNQGDPARACFRKQTSKKNCDFFVELRKAAKLLFSLPEQKLTWNFYPVMVIPIVGLRICVRQKLLKLTTVPAVITD